MTKYTSDGTEYTIDYRIYYGEKNPAYATSGDAHRSDHIYKTGTSFTETLYVGDVIRVVNVELGALFYVVENLADDSPYTLESIDYSIANGDGDAADYAEDDIVTKEDNTTWYSVKGNSACYATITNKLDSVFYIYHSGVEGDGNLETIPMSDCSADLTYNLYAKTTPGTLYGGYYLDYEGKGDYKDDGVAGTTGVKYTGMNYENWASCEPQTLDGREMKPVAGETYYIKEVPTYYLRNYYQITYVKVSFELKSLYLISAIDDLNYNETGFVITKNNADGSQTAKVVKTMTYKNWATGKTATLKANNVFKKVDGDDAITADTEYLTYYDATNNPEYFAAGVTLDVLPYWITPDEIKVTGISTRRISITELTKSGISKQDLY